MAPSDAELIDRVRASDTGAFELLFLRYHEPIRRHLAQIVRDEEAAVDLVQEVFVRVWTRADQWDGRGAFKAWLFRIATNQAISYLRSPRRRDQSLDSALSAALGEDAPTAAWMVESPAVGPDVRAFFAEQHASLRRLVDRLPSEKRAVFRMVHEAEMDVREVAETLGIPEGTVKSRLHYARKWLARAWQQEEQEEDP